jgi:hypothetical protein
MNNESFNNQSANDNACAPVIEFKSIARTLEQNTNESPNEAQVIQFRSMLKQPTDYNPRPPEAA